MKTGIIASIIIYLSIGLFGGVIESANKRMSGLDGCRYKSYISYVNPAYIGMCELTRVRFIKPETDYYNNN